MTYAEEDDVSELDLVYDDLTQAKLDAKCAAEVAERRIAELTAALEEALQYFQDRYDVIDGDNGKQQPNKEMRLGAMIAEAIHGIRF
jgi:hypothetical protein